MSSPERAVGLGDLAQGPASVDCDVDAVMGHRVHQLCGAALDILRVVGIVDETGPGDEQGAAAAQVHGIYIWRRA